MTKETYLLLVKLVTVFLIGVTVGRFWFPLPRYPQFQIKDDSYDFKFINGKGEEVLSASEGKMVVGHIDSEGRCYISTVGDL